ncbi:glycine--tRNA ligase subunit beta [uncultured Veillonella sp.]|uniref:glycine--tRNA ligase subunit beta n=1 Tax=uncultured Veillonella sp. TaxID=159268 RepID=UPI00261C7D1B|nr:glycine--tRNA ligase subunit beta [uncultured Veillonella sp.]
MAKDLLFEIGAEEIPAGAMPGILSQLKSLTETKLKEHHLGYQAIRTLGTPRRIILLVDGVNDTSDTLNERHKGPSAKIAFDADGNATKAAQGFARGKGIDVADLVVEDGYIYANTTTEGVDAMDIFTKILPELIHDLSFPKSMHWGDLDDKFIRPIRWILALLDTALIPVEFAGVRSSTFSRGHRFLGKRGVLVQHPVDYLTALEENFVIVDPEKRRQMIVEQLEAIAAEKKATIVWDEDLLDEVVYLVEYPTALCGTFDTSYLELPDAAVITPMKDHQRYFPLTDGEGKLLPMFLTVRNGDAKSIDVVAAGNERVLRARLDDAKFFFNEDRKKSLAERTDGLTKIVFQEGLGNLANKTDRLLELGTMLGDMCGLEEDEMAELERATVLAKTDLTTGMVTEFTELQGVIGKEYALLDGESEEVAEAIFEQYLPRFAGDMLPTTAAGKVLSIIDKVDNIVATFSRGLIPTGSQDPYALRRQTIGVLNILSQSGYNVSLEPLWRANLSLLGVDESKHDEIVAQLAHFFVLRLKNIYLDHEVPHAVIELVLSKDSTTVAAADGLVKAVMNHRVDENVELVQAFTRMYNLVKEVTYEAVDAKLFETKEEQALYDLALGAYEESKAAYEAGDFAKVVALPETLVPAINAFFEAVMVMADDEAVKANRLQLVRLAYEVMYAIGDVSALK